MSKNSKTSSTIKAQTSSKTHKYPHLKLILISLLVLCIAFILAINSPTTKSLLSVSISNIFSKEASSTSGNQEKTPPSQTNENMASAADDSWKTAQSIYEFSAKDIDGNLIKLDKYKGRVVLIVNVACNCGFTAGNYPQMQELHKKYESQGLSVLAFPCNQFGGQEPGAEAEIKDFIKQYDVQFEMYSKINVNGDGAHPLYKYLKSKVDGTFGNFIKWNFSKFLVNREGIPIKRYAPTTAPKDIENDIVKLLGEKSNL